MMPKYIRLYFLRVGNFEGTPGRNQYALVAYLPTGLGVERRAIQHNYGELAHRHGLDQCAFAIDRDDFCVLDGKRVVAPEFGLAALVFDAHARLKPGGRARAFTLRLHLALEAGHIELEIAFQRDIAREVRREAVRIIELENDRARNGITIECSDVILKNC